MIKTLIRIKCVVIIKKENLIKRGNDTNDFKYLSPFLINFVKPC